jgi:hypothetical protein
VLHTEGPYAITGTPSTPGSWACCWAPLWRAGWDGGWGCSCSPWCGRGQGLCRGAAVDQGLRGGLPAVPPTGPAAHPGLRELTGVMVLQALEGLSDREAIAALRPKPPPARGAGRLWPRCRWPPLPQDSPLKAQRAASVSGSPGRGTASAAATRAGSSAPPLPVVPAVRSGPAAGIAPPLRMRSVAAAASDDKAADGHGAAAASPHIPADREDRRRCESPLGRRPPLPFAGYVIELEICARALTWSAGGRHGWESAWVRSARSPR